MKRHFFLQIIAAILVSLIISGCNKAGKQSKGTASEGKGATGKVEVFDTVKVKSQIIEIIQKSPKPVEIIDLLNDAGASYIFDLTVPMENVEKMLTSTQKAIGLGLYGFDNKYASVYNRIDVFLKIRDNINRLIADLGLQENLSGAKKYQERIEKNKSNADSVNFLVNQIFNNFHQYMQDGAHADIYALSFIGANIEALYVLSQMTLLAKNNEKLLTIMNNQNQRVKSLASLLEIMSGDEHVKPYYEKIQPLIQFFGEKDIIKNADLNKIALLIENARNSMIQK